MSFWAGVALTIVLPLVGLIPWWLIGNHSFENQYWGVIFSLLFLIPICFSYAVARYAGRYDKVAFITPFVPALTSYLFGYLEDIQIQIQAAATHTFIHSLGSASPFDVVAQLMKMAMPAFWALMIGGVGIKLNRLINPVVKREVGTSQDDVLKDNGKPFRKFCVYVFGVILLVILVYPFYVRTQYTPDARCKRAEKALFSAHTSMASKFNIIQFELGRIPGAQSIRILRRALNELAYPSNYLAATVLAQKNDISGLPLLEWAWLHNPPQIPHIGLQGDNSTVARNLAYISDPQAIPALQRLMQSKLQVVREGAINGLRNMDSDLVIDSLIASLEDPDPTVRWIASMGLSKKIDREWMPHGEKDFLKNEKKYTDHWREWAQTSRKSFRFISHAELEAKSVYVPPPEPTTFKVERSDGEKAVLKYLDKYGTLNVPTSIEGLPVVSIGDNTFYESNLKRLILPEGIQRIGNSAFARCPDLTNVVIPSSVTFIGNKAFYGCTNLQSIDVDTENPIYRSIDGILFNKRATVILRYPPAKPDTLYRIPDMVCTIATSSFAMSKKLTEVIIPNSVTYIGAEAFQHCWNLTNIIVSENVTTICSDAFSDCSYLRNIRIPGSVTNMNNTPFYWCHQLVSVSVDSNSQSYQVIDQVLFNKQCTRLIQYLPAKTNAQYTIPSSVTSLGPHSFSLCKNLKSLTIPDGVTNIEAGAFKNSASLSNISIPIHLHRIEAEVFWNCGLTSVTIPNEVTSIGADAFSSCHQLIDVSIPASVTNIESGAFSFCSSLTNVSFLGPVPRMDHDVFRCTSSNLAVQYRGGEVSSPVTPKKNNP